MDEDKYQIKGTGRTPLPDDPFSSLPELTLANPPSFLDRLLGRSEPELWKRAAPNRDWPTDSDVAVARKYDSAYASPTAPVGMMARRPSFDQVVQYHDVTNRPPEDREEPSGMYNLAREKAWLAANRSALGSLGYDPRAVISTRDNGRDSSLAGFYRPSVDTVWYNERYPSTVMHESYHRALQKLRDAGVLPSYANGRGDEERIIRGLMLQNFGDIEKMPEWATEGNRQIEDARRLMGDSGYDAQAYKMRHGKTFEEHLAELEAIAAAQIGKRGRGPHKSGGRAKAENKALHLARRKKKIR